MYVIGSINVYFFNASQLMIDKLQNNTEFGWFIIKNHRKKLIKWNASYILCVEDCANKTYKNVNDIFIKWPILKLDSSYVLVYFVLFIYIVL